MLNAIHRVAGELPPDQRDALITVLKSVPHGDWQETRKRVMDVLGIQPFQTRVSMLMDQWQFLLPETTPSSLALGLTAAAYSIEQLQSCPALELVWRGPLGGTATFRRTEQALLELIHHARKRLLIVTFAAYRASLIQEAIGSAIQRGVSFRFIGESANESGSKISFDAFSGYDGPNGNGANVFLWPQDQRLINSEGKCGSLHVKCAVADEEYLLLSSANLTEYAMSLNMEMGVLIKGGSLPSQVVQHFDRLIQNGILARFYPFQVA